MITPALVIAGFLAVSSNAVSSSDSYHQKYDQIDDAASTETGNMSERDAEYEQPYEKEGYGYDQEATESTTVFPDEKAESVEFKEKHLTENQTQADILSGTLPKGKLVSSESTAAEANESNQSKSSPTPSPDLLSFLGKIVLRSLGKDALKNLDVEAACDTIQLVDWNTYKNLLVLEDFTGLKERLSKDAILTSISETLLETFEKYGKAIAEANQSMLAKSLKQFQEFLSIDKPIKQNKEQSVDAKKNIKEFVQGFVIDKGLQKEGLEIMQSNIKSLLEALQPNKSHNSIELSEKSELYPYSKGLNY